MNKRLNKILKIAVGLLLMGVIWTYVLTPMIIMGAVCMKINHEPEAETKIVHFEYRRSADDQWTRGLDAAVFEKEGIICVAIKGGVNPKTGITQDQVIKFPTSGGSGTYYIRYVHSKQLVEEGVVNNMTLTPRGWEGTIVPTSTKEPEHFARFIEKDEFGL